MASIKTYIISLVLYFHARGVTAQQWQQEPRFQEQQAVHELEVKLVANVATPTNTPIPQAVVCVSGGVSTTVSATAVSAALIAARMCGSGPGFTCSATAPQKTLFPHYFSNNGNLFNTLTSTGGNPSKTTWRDGLTIQPLPTGGVWTGGDAGSIRVVYDSNFQYVGVINAMTSGNTVTVGCCLARWDDRSPFAECTCDLRFNRGENIPVCPLLG